MNPDLWIPFLVLGVMLSFALASLSAVKKKQEKLDKLECQLARLENRLESRFKLPNIDPSTLDTKYMTLDEMSCEENRLWLLIDARDILDKESILKSLDDAKDELEKWKNANREGLLEMNIMSTKYRRHSRLMEREKEYCRGWLGSVIGSARWKISDWEWDRRQEEWNKQREERKGNTKNGKGKRTRPKNRRRTDSRPCHAPTDDFLVCQSGNRHHPSARQRPNQRKD